MVFEEKTYLIASKDLVRLQRLALNPDEIPDFFLFDKLTKCVERIKLDCLRTRNYSFYPEVETAFLVTDPDSMFFHFNYIQYEVNDTDNFLLIYVYSEV